MHCILAFQPGSEPESVTMKSTLALPLTLNQKKAAKVTQR